MHQRDLDLLEEALLELKAQALGEAGSSLVLSASTIAGALEKAGVCGLMRRHQLKLEPSEEPGRIRCPGCDGALFFLNTEAEEPSRGTDEPVGNVECAGCHRMFTVRFV